MFQKIIKVFQNIHSFVKLYWVSEKVSENTFSVSQLSDTKKSMLGSLNQSRNLLNSLTHSGVSKPSEGDSKKGLVAHKHFQCTKLVLKAQFRIVTYLLFLKKKVIKTQVMKFIFQHLIQYLLIIWLLEKKKQFN